MLCKSDQEMKIMDEGTSKRAGMAGSQVGESCAQHRPASLCEALGRAQITPAGPALECRWSVYRSEAGQCEHPQGNMQSADRYLEIAWGHLPAARKEKDLRAMTLDRAFET